MKWIRRTSRSISTRVVLAIAGGVASFFLCGVIADSRLDVAVDIRTTDAAELRVGYASAGEFHHLSDMEPVSHELPIPAGGGTRFHAFLPRKHLGQLAVEVGGANLDQISKIQVGTLIPTMFAGNELSRLGYSEAAGNPAVHRVVLPALSAVERGGIATFILLWVILWGTCLIGRRVIQLLTAPFPERDFSGSLAFKSIVFTRTFAGFFVPLVVLWTFFLLVFYPGAVPGDPALQWTMGKHTAYGQSHSMLHTLLMGSISHYRDSASTVAFIQLCVLAFMLSYGFVFLLRLGVRRDLVYLSFGLVLIWPLFGVYAITIRKGVAYAITTLEVTICLTRLILDRQARESWSSWIALGIGLGLMPLFRVNGLLVLWCILPVLLVAFYKHPRVYASACLMFVLYYGFTTVAVPFFRPRPRIPAQSSRGLQMSVGSLIAQDLPFAPDEYAYLHRVRPLTDQWGYSTVYTRDYRNKLNKRYLRRNHGEFMDIAKSLVGRYPLLLIKSRFDAAAYLFSPNGRPGETAINCYSLDVHRLYPYKRTEASLFPQLRTWVSAALIRTKKPDLIWLFWRPTLWFYALVIAAAALCLRQRSLLYLLPACPAFLTMVSVVLAAPAQHVRYVLSLYFVLVFFAPLARLPQTCLATEPVTESGSANGIDRIRSWLGERRRGHAAG